MGRCEATPRLRPTAEMLAGNPLCELDMGQGYDELLAHTLWVVDEGLQLRVLDLPTLIAVKSRAGRPKDRMALPILIATLQERDKTKR